MEFAFVSNAKDGSEAPEVYVRDPDVMACGNDETASLLKCRYRLLTDDVQQRKLRRFGVPINQVDDLTLMLSRDSRMRIGNEVANCGRMPVVTPCKAAFHIHAL